MSSLTDNSDELLSKTTSADEFLSKTAPAKLSGDVMCNAMM